MMVTYIRHKENYVNARARFPKNPIGRKPSQLTAPKSSGAPTAQASQLSVYTSLPRVADQVRQVQASLAYNTRAEFASVTAQLNASQGKSGQQESGGTADKDGVQ